MPGARMRAAALLGFLVVVFPGCLDEGTPVTDEPAEPVAVEPAKAYNVAFQGKVPLYALESFGHSRPAEDALWPISQSGFLLVIPKVPAAYEVKLEWSALRGGEYLIMLHSHKAHGTNVYVEHITNWSSATKACLRVPAKDLADGTWQVMIHTRDVVASQYTLTATTWGVESKMDPERHGHKPEDGAFQVDKHAIEPCLGRAA